MKKQYFIGVMLAAILFALNEGYAQTAQTAEGAQKFIVSLINSGKIRPNLSFRLNPDGKGTGRDSWWAGASVQVIDGVHISGNKDDCSMVIRTIDRERPDIVESSIAWRTPIHIDWRKATLTRYDDGTGMDLQVPIDRYERMLVRFNVDDPELLDRVEYAMKFLQMSCDSSVDRGF